MSSLAMNTLTNQFDPHSSYMSPYNAEDFEIDMSLKLGGIGAHFLQKMIMQLLLVLFQEDLLAFQVNLMKRIEL